VINPSGNLNPRFWEDQAGPIISVQFRIKVMMFSEFRGEQYDLSFLRCFFESAHVLEYAVITYAAPCEDIALTAEPLAKGNTADQVSMPPSTFPAVSVCGDDLHANDTSAEEVFLDTTGTCSLLLQCRLRYQPTFPPLKLFSDCACAQWPPPLADCILSSSLIIDHHCSTLIFQSSLIMTCEDLCAARP
jgi:hypothetical protein